MNTSLSTVIVNSLRKKEEEKEITPTTLDYFEGLFHPKRGIELPSYFTDQSRITDGLNEETEKFSFFPNRLVVETVFPLIY